MTTLILFRHGRTAANASGLLAGWTPGVGLDETGREQVAAAAARLSAVPLAAVVSSPLQRCQESAHTVVAGRDGVEVQIDDRLGECRYGDWTGQPLKTLAKDPMWKVVQQHPSAAVFPGPEGEGLATTSARALAAVRDWNARLGPDATWLACSHGDVIKAVLADALGMHLDMFQRLMVEPASVSVIVYTLTRPYVLRSNDVGGDLSGLIPPKRGRRRRRRAVADGAVGGGGSYHASA
ncbi:MAG: MSMEG_4193 family putative phosphomutase [Geodermatophilaceae bacterium]|jgi:probable phosphomutase (TIGR03848 family)|nr:MSMEG_4193 family putative phosphomutase [Geodermatophilaceae bacterium]